jgi:hypothetical protein
LLKKSIFDIISRSSGRFFLANLVVLRPPCIPNLLVEECKILCAMTIYQKSGEIEKDLAPRFTDCLTAIAFLFRKCQYWRLDWIGNMPRKLLLEYGFTTEKGMHKGDVVFFANSEGVTKHIAIGLSDMEVFHCSQANKGGKIECITDLFTKRFKRSQLPMYCEITTPTILICQIDPRSHQNKKSHTIDPENEKRSFAILSALSLPCQMTESIAIDMDCDDSSRSNKKKK